MRSGAGGRASGKAKCEMWVVSNHRNTLAQLALASSGHGRVRFGTTTTYLASTERQHADLLSSASKELEEASMGFRWTRAI